MRLFLSMMVLMLAVVVAGSVNAQDLRKNEIVVIKGEKYIIHQVKAGETVYSISKKYQLADGVLVTANPKIADGLKTGDMLKIPYGEKAKTKSVPFLQKKGEPSGFTTYKVKSKGETVASIAMENGISAEDLMQYNQGLKKIKKGKRLQIPFWEKEEPVIEEPIVAEEPEMVEDSAPIRPAGGREHTVASGETLFSLARKYAVTEQDILKYNAEARNLKAGAVLFIPKSTVAKTVERKPKVFEGKPGTKYVEHIIESGETLWGITRKYGVSEAVLKELNPVLASAFPAGAVIHVPVKEVELTQAKPVNEDAFIKHLVQPGETMFGLSRQYEISIPELKQHNPVLESRNPVIGETLLIRKKMEALIQKDENTTDDVIETEAPEIAATFFDVDVTVEVPESCQPDLTGLFKEQHYDIALFLPLFLEANDTLNREDLVLADSLATEGLESDMPEVAEQLVEIDTAIVDTTIEVERKELFKKFYGNTENYVQFYEGVLLAVENLRNEGVDVTLHVFDTQRKADSIRQFIYTDAFLQTDLIIGPIYPNLQNEVAEIAAKNRIPIVSPLAPQSKIMPHNPQYFQVNPSREYLAMQTAEMVAEEHYNSNFIILKTREYEGTPEGELVNMIREKLFNTGMLSQNEGVNFTIYDYKQEGAFGLRRIMSNVKENVVYIPASREGDLSIAISNVNNLAGDYSITLIGSSRYPNFNSIQIDHFHNLKLKYLTPYWVDYSAPKTIDFVEAFKYHFGTEPNNFGMQGYDVTRYFMGAYTSYGANFTDCLPYFHTNQIQGNYHFEKASQFGGYMNQGVSVVEYTRDYKVIRRRVKGQPRLVTAVE